MSRREVERIKREVKAQGFKVKNKVEQKNAQKLKTLEERYGNKGKVFKKVKLTEMEAGKYGHCKVFNDRGISLDKYEVKPVVVNGKGENVCVNEDENKFLGLGPKFCITGKLSEEDCEVSVEECIAKLKWDVMGEDLKKSKEDPAMEAISAVIDEDQLDDLEEHEMKNI